MAADRPAAAVRQAVGETMAHMLSREEHERIAQAIKAAESNTSGEIYCVVARASANYFFPAALIATVATMIVSFLVALLAEHWWYQLQPATLVLAQLLAVGCVLALLGLLPAVRIHFVPRRQRYREAHRNAVKQFLGRNIHMTTARTGVLLFVSLAERYAEVLADSGINESVPQQTWDAVVVGLTGHAARGAVADGLVEAIAAVGVVLAEHFPVSAHDTNELDDHVIEI